MQIFISIPAILMRRARHVRWNILIYGQGEKGIHIVGTGDFTHPAWRAELKEKLAPAEDGLYILKEEYRLYDEADGKKSTHTGVDKKR